MLKGTKENILKREDGSRVKIAVAVYSRYSDDLEWKFKVSTCEPNKRTWRRAHNSDDYFFRKLSREEQKAYILEKSLEVVTAEEILAVQLEVWEGIKPALILPPENK